MSDYEDNLLNYYDFGESDADSDDDYEFEDKFVIEKDHRMLLSTFRRFCDICAERSPDDVLGGVVTLKNSDKKKVLRELSELCVKFYNDAKNTKFKLVKACKTNFAPSCYAVTFKAREDGSEECLLFRGAVSYLTESGEEAVFCEIKVS